MSGNCRQSTFVCVIRISAINAAALTVNTHNLNFNVTLELEG